MAANPRAAAEGFLARLRSATGDELLPFDAAAAVRALRDAGARDAALSVSAALIERILPPARLLAEADVVAAGRLSVLAVPGLAGGAGPGGRVLDAVLRRLAQAPEDPALRLVPVGEAHSTWAVAVPPGSLVLLRHERGHDRDTLVAVRVEPWPDVAADPGGVDWAGLAGGAGRVLAGGRLDIAPAAGGAALEARLGALAASLTVPADAVPLPDRGDLLWVEDGGPAWPALCVSGFAANRGGGAVAACPIVARPGPGTVPVPPGLFPDGRHIEAGWTDGGVRAVPRRAATMAGRVPATAVARALDRLAAG